MIIEYETNKSVKEKQELEIEDTKNVFLKGTNPYDRLPTYFGIWSNNSGLSIVTIISYRTISYQHLLNKNLHTECDIKEYLKSNNNVQVITQNEFKELIQHIRTIFEI